MVQDKLQPTDVIHVIADPDEQRDYAIQLYQKGNGKKILYAGGWPTFHTLWHGQDSSERAFQRGVPSNRRQQSSPAEAARWIYSQVPGD